MSIKKRYNSMIRILGFDSIEKIMYEKRNRLIDVGNHMLLEYIQLEKLMVYYKYLATYPNKLMFPNSKAINLLKSYNINWFINYSKYLNLGCIWIKDLGRNL